MFQEIPAQLIKSEDLSAEDNTYGLFMRAGNANGITTPKRSRRLHFPHAEIEKYNNLKNVTIEQKYMFQISEKDDQTKPP